MRGVFNDVQILNESTKVTPSKGENNSKINKYGKFKISSKTKKVLI